MRFIGSKTRLLQEIEIFLQENKISGNTFCDIFAGTSSVGDYFKSKYKIISNDFLKFSTDFAKAKLWNSKIPHFKNFKKKYQTEPFEYFNEKKYEYDKNFYITNNYAPTGNRQYFSDKNAVEIDGIRIEIEEIYKNKIFNEQEYYFLLASLLESAMSFSNTTLTKKT
jgi:adenine-specific DNA-methyltransferase